MTDREQREPSPPAEPSVDDGVARIDLGFDGEDVARLFDWSMPFGRFRGRALIDLPEDYLLWFERNGFPQGDLGRLLKLSLGIKRYGAEPAIKRLREPLRGTSAPRRS